MVFLSSTTTCELSLPVFQFFEGEDVEYFFGLVFVFFLLFLSLFLRESLRKSVIVAALPSLVLARALPHLP